MRFILALLILSFAGEALRLVMSRRRDLRPPSSPPRLRVDTKIGLAYELAQTSRWALALAGTGLTPFLFTFAITFPLLWLFPMGPSRQEDRVVFAIFGAGLAVGPLVGLWVARWSRRQKPSALELFDDRVLLPSRGLAKLAVYTTIPFAELRAVTPVRDDILIFTGIRDSASLSANDILSITNIHAIREAVEAAVKASADGEAIARTIAQEEQATQALAERPATAINQLTFVLMAVYAVEWLVASSNDWQVTLYRLGANVRRPWTFGQTYRLITANYLHSSLIHLFSNLGAIGTFGGLMEKVVGSARLIVIFTLSAVCGAFFSSFVDPLAVGASTGAFGLMAAYAVVQHTHRGGLPRTFQIPVRSWLLLVGANAALPLFLPNISWAGHAGGALAGAIVASFLVRSPVAVEGGSAPLFVRALATVLLVAQFAAFLEAGYFAIQPLDFRGSLIRAIAIGK